MSISYLKIVKVCMWSLDQNLIELAKTRVWERNHKCVLQAFSKLILTCSKSGVGQFKKLNLQLVITTMGGPSQLCIDRTRIYGDEPYGQIPFHILKFSLSSWDGKRRPKEFHPAFTIGSKTQQTHKLLIENSLKGKPTILSPFERLHA